MVNGGGLAGMFLPWLLHGTFLVQHHPFDIETFCAQVERHGVTYTCAPPPVLNALVSDGARTATSPACARSRPARPPCPAG